MSPDIYPANAHLIGLWLQVLATGAYYVYLAHFIAILRRKVHDGMSLWMPAICALIFTIVTTDFVIETIRVYSAFAVSGPGGTIHPDPQAYLGQAAAPLSLAKNATTIALAIVSDMIMVYRTFIVWTFNYLIVMLSIGLLMSSTEIGIWATWTLSKTASGDEAINAEVSVRVKYFFLITFCLNLLCATLICYKVWHITRQVAAYRIDTDRTVSRVSQAVIETAAFYCAHVFILIVADYAGSNVFFIFLNPLLPVTGIVFSMLFVRTRLQPHADLTITNPGTSSLRFDVSTRSTARRRVSSTPYGVEIDLERVAQGSTDTEPDLARGAEGRYGAGDKELLERVVRIVPEPGTGGDPGGAQLTADEYPRERAQDRKGTGIVL